MANVIVQLPLDLSGTNPNNAIGSEEHLLTKLDGFPYSIITMEHGGFYSKSLKVFDEKYNRLKVNEDFIWTYRHNLISERTGRDVASAIVFINKNLKGKVFLQAQMVGGDVAYSFTVIQDYIAFYKTKPTTYVPTIDDYVGTEPIWAPGELANERWGLDTYQPFNNELENIRRAMTMGAIDAEQKFRDAVKNRFDEFMAKFTDRLKNHIDDKNDPHQITPTQVNLGIVNNYAVASSAVALAGTSDDTYLTPKLVNEVLDGVPTTRLNAHINTVNSDPHNTTAASLNAYSKQQLADSLATVYDKTSTVANTLGIYYCKQNTITAINMRGRNYLELTNGQFGPGNCAYYDVISNVKVPIAAGDYLSYSMFIETTLPGSSQVCQSGIDARINSGKDINLRDWPYNAPRNIFDQNGIYAHPAGPTEAYARNRWYARRINLTPVAGKSLDQWCIAFEGDPSGWYSSYFRDVYVRRANGTIKATIYNGRLQIPTLRVADYYDSKSYLNKTKGDVTLPDPDNPTACLWMSYNTYLNDVARKNFTTGDFSTGLVKPECLALPVPSNRPRAMFRGDGTWTDVGIIKRDYAARRYASKITYIQL